MDDYPNESDAIHENWIPEKSESQQRQENEEHHNITSSVGVIKDVLAWFAEREKMFGDLDALEINEGTDPNTALIILSTSKRLKSEFKAKRQEFETTFEKYLQDADETT